MFAIESLIQEAMEYWALNDYKKAYQCLDNILEKFPDNINALGVKGSMLEDEGLNSDANQDLLFDKARQCYERVLKINPMHLQAIIDLGDYWRRKDANHNALEMYQKAILVWENYKHDDVYIEDIIDVHHEILSILEELEEFDNLKLFIKQAIKFAPDSDCIIGFKDKYLK